MSNLSREIEDIIGVVRATEGWRVVDGTHFKVFAPDGTTIITVSKTPGSQVRIKAYKARFAKLGVSFQQGKKGQR